MALLIAVTLVLALLPAGAARRARAAARDAAQGAARADRPLARRAAPGAARAGAARWSTGSASSSTTLAPQLATLDEDEPAADEIRKLVGEQLPDFINGYARVPQPLRGVERNGKTPDAQLTDGLSVIDGEIAEMTAKLAQGDLDSLATRERYLQIKYRGDEGGPG